MNNIGLREMRYTSHITHVGANAIANCTSLYKVTFDEGCTLDNGSDPISPILNDGGINISITDVKLAASVGDFMSTYSNFQKLSRVSNLILGEYERISDLPEKEDQIRIRKNYESVTYTPTEFQNNVVLAIIFIIPLVIVIAGIIIWQVRRRKK